MFQFTFLILVVHDDGGLFIILNSPSTMYQTGLAREKFFCPRYVKLNSRCFKEVVTTVTTRTGLWRNLTVTWNNVSRPKYFMVTVVHYLWLHLIEYYPNSPPFNVLISRVPVRTSVLSFSWIRSFTFGSPVVGPDRELGQDIHRLNEERKT